MIFYLYIIRDKSLSLKIAIALILGGAVGNLIDRTFYGLFYDYAPLFYGKVVDFFDFDFFNFTLFGRSYDRWPIFNIADAAVTIGVLILVIFL
ncbi:MAG: signal peptidase II [Ignavibacteriales bacterium]|nr:signal peptidase II [Ignavibacteriales bacterium]